MCCKRRNFFNDLLLKTGLKIFLILSQGIVLAFLNAGFVQAADNDVNLSNQYVIVVASSKNELTKKDLGNAYGDDKYRYYTVKLSSDNGEIYELKYGFFATMAAAKKEQKKLKIFFKNTYIEETKQAERDASYLTEVKAGANVSAVEHLVLSTTYDAASAFIDVAGNVLDEEEKDDGHVIEIHKSKKDQNLPKFYYVLNLKTTNDLGDFEKVIEHPEIIDNAFYLSELQIDGKNWYQYRLGFFLTEEAAKDKMKNLSENFPLARVIRISAKEKEMAANKVRTFFADDPTGDVEKQLPKLNPISENKLEILFKRGSKALSNKRYEVAIKYFRQLLRYPEHEYSMDSQEFLGFAYELSHQINYSRKEYSRYLSLYPESSGATRVRQRMASLLTARVDPQERLRKRNQQLKNAKWQTFSSLSQFYRLDNSQLNSDPTLNNLSLLSTGASVNSRYRGADYVMESRFVGTYDADFAGDNTRNSTSITELSFNVNDLKRNLYASIGRQNLNKDGVLGRMDGVKLSYVVNENLRLNTVAGFVVENTRKNSNTDRFFTGISADLGTYANAWDFNVYYISQTDGSIVGREAVGSEIRYFDPQRTLFALIDYDVKFKELNSFLVNGHWQLKNNIQLNGAIDIRKSPFLTTSNALLNLSDTVGQVPDLSGARTVDDLLALGLTEDEISARAAALTATSQAYLLGINMPVSEFYQVTLDVSRNTLSSSGIPGGTQSLGTGAEYLYNLQLLGTSVFMDNDSTIFGYRYADTDRSVVNSISVNTRIPLNREWRLNPRIRFDERKNTDGTEQSVTAFALRVDYRFKRNVNFELDFGREISNRVNINNTNNNLLVPNTTNETVATFFSLGFRYNF